MPVACTQDPLSVRFSNVVQLIVESLRLEVSVPQWTAAENAIGTLRRDPFAMLPFTGYNVGDAVHRLARPASEAVPAFRDIESPRRTLYLMTALPWQAA